MYTTLCIIYNNIEYNYNSVYRNFRYYYNEELLVTVVLSCTCASVYHQFYGLWLPMEISLLLLLMYASAYKSPRITQSGVCHTRKSVKVAFETAVPRQ